MIKYLLIILLYCAVILLSGSHSLELAAASAGLLLVLHLVVLIFKKSAVKEYPSNLSNPLSPLNIDQSANTNAGTDGTINKNVFDNFAKNIKNTPATNTKKMANKRPSNPKQSGLTAQQSTAINQTKSKKVPNKAQNNIVAQENLPYPSSKMKAREQAILNHLKKKAMATNVNFSEELEIEKAEQGSKIDSSQKKKAFDVAQLKQSSYPIKGNTSPKKESAFKAQPLDKLKSLTEMAKADQKNQLKKSENSNDLFSDFHIPLKGDDGDNARTNADDNASNNNANSNESLDQKSLKNLDDSIGQALSNDNSVQDKLEEANSLLNLVESSLKAKKVDSAKAALQSYNDLLEQSGEPASLKAKFWEAKILLIQNDHKSAFAGFEKNLSKLNKNSKNYGESLKEVCELLDNSPHKLEGLKFYYDLLNYYRQLLERENMDRTYEKIESILEISGDDDKLIRAYKNHLEIKRILKDHYGESRLLDLIGNRYYKMGEKELSRKFYEDNIKLKENLK